MALSVGLALVLHRTAGCGSAAFHHVTNGIGPDACTDAWNHGGGVGFPLVAVGAVMLPAGLGRAVYLRLSLWT